MPSAPTTASTVRHAPTIATSLVVIENRVLANRPVAATAASGEPAAALFCSFSQARISLEMAAERRENSPVTLSLASASSRWPPTARPSTSAAQVWNCACACLHAV